MSKLGTAKVALGTLQLDSRGCLAIDRTTIEWPQGYRARTTSQGSVEVLNARGQVVARTGQRLSVGGGGTTTRTGPCLENAGSVFEVADLTAG